MSNLTIALFLAAGILVILVIVLAYLCSVKIFDSTVISAQAPNEEGERCRQYGFQLNAMEHKRAVLATAIKASAWMVAVLVLSGAALAITERLFPEKTKIASSEPALPSTIKPPPSPPILPQPKK